MYFIVAATILCRMAIPVTPSHHEIHKLMTLQQIKQVFGTTPDKLPKYELVNVKMPSMRKRDTQFGIPIQIQGRDRNINLPLKRASGFLAGINTPVTIANMSGNDIQYVDDPTIMQSVGELLQEHRTGSSFILSQNRNLRYALDGFIESENLIIRSLPEEIFDASSNHFDHHVMFKSTDQRLQEDSSNNLLQSSSPENTETIQETIYPELLLVVDESSYSAHDSDIIRTVRYTLILWNSVQIRYNKLKDLRVRINIARIIVATDPRATPYIQSKVLTDTVDALMVLDQSGKYFYSRKDKFSFDSYDAIVIMTRHNLSVDGDEIAGYGYRGSFCHRDIFEEKMWGTAVFHDGGTYWSIIPAHELAHVLGASHDNVTCPKEDGYIMSPAPISSKNNWAFSSCSIEEIKNTIEQADSQCLREVPKKVGRLIPKISVDMSMTLAKQCLLEFGTEPCPFKIAEVRKKDFCRTLACVHPIDNISCIIRYGYELPEGTPCGNGEKVCLRGKCVVHSKFQQFLLRGHWTNMTWQTDEPMNISANFST